MPDVVGLDQDAAGDALVDAGLTLGSVSGSGSVVVRQSRPAGTWVPLGTPVGVRLGGQPRPLVPDLQALTLDEARAALDLVGLDLAAEGPADGLVVAQDPDPDTEVEPGSVVTVELETTSVTPPIRRRPVALLAGSAAVAGSALVARRLQVRRSRAWISQHVSVLPRPTAWGTDPAPAPDPDDDPGPVVRLEVAVDDGEYVEEDDP